MPAASYISEGARAASCIRPAAYLSVVLLWLWEVGLGDWLWGQVKMRQNSGTHKPSQTHWYRFFSSSLSPSLSVSFFLSPLVFLSLSVSLSFSPPRLSFSLCVSLSVSVTLCFCALLFLCLHCSSGLGLCLLRCEQKLPNRPRLSSLFSLLLLSLPLSLSLSLSFASLWCVDYRQWTDEVDHVKSSPLPLHC